MPEFKQKLTIKNFGPIKDVIINVDDFMLFIGDVAEGKSTICKAIHYFKSLRDDYIDLIELSIKTGAFFSNDLISHFKSDQRTKFLNFFGPTMHLENFLLRFDYSKYHYISIDLTDEGYINHGFSTDLNNILINLYAEAQDKSKDQKNTISENVYSEILKKIYKVFGDSRDILYIPATRGVVSSMTRYVSDIYKNFNFLNKDNDKNVKIDLITQDYIRFIDEKIKPYFLDDIMDIIRSKTYAHSLFNIESINEILDISHNVIKGKYRNLNGDDRLYLDNTSNHVKLNYASSGQQEAVWIVNILLYFLLENVSSFIICEEPETHLSPDAQGYFMQILAVFANVNGNGMVISTHSPYILTMINNMLYAKTINKKGIEIDETSISLPPRCWLNGEKVGVYQVKRGGVESIKNNETQLLNSEQIDKKINDKIADTFDSLYEQENKE
jgi:predicted ATP-dependent endonuclease of OLD family